jgi:hypothetical protein
MEKKTLGLVLLLAGTVAGCATSPAGPNARGAIVSATAGTWAVVRGPHIVHAYAGNRGGELYNVAATTGTDADCAPPKPGRGSVTVPADRVVTLVVPAGEVTCLHASATGYELLWHTVQPAVGPAVIVADVSQGQAVRQ